MTEELKKNDFIELRYVGKIKDTGEIFDTNIEEEAKKLNPNIKNNLSIICLGQNMILPAIDKFLIGKKPGKYILELQPKDAFGNRDPKLIKTMPLSVFSQHNITPQTGMVFAFDNLLGKISAVSSGRVIVDFNNPLAGKTLIYELEVKRKITEKKEKVEALFSAFFKKKFPFKIENKKLIIKAEKDLAPIINSFKEKFKEILNMEIEIKEIKNQKSENNNKK